MNSKITKILSIVLWALLIVSGVLIVMLVKSVDTPSMDGRVNTILWWAKVLLFTAIGIAVIFSITQTFSSKTNAKKSIISFGIIAAVFLAANTMASSEIPQFFGAAELVKKGILTEWWAKATDTILYVTYILFFGAIISIIYSSVSRVWK